MAEFHHLGEYLKERRANSGYTQSELASALGDVHSQFVSNWERGLCAPPGHSLHKLIQLLKLNREKLVEVMLEDSRIVIEARVFRKKQVQKKRA